MPPIDGTTLLIGAALAVALFLFLRPRPMTPERAERLALARWGKVGAVATAEPWGALAFRVDMQARSGETATALVDAATGRVEEF